MYYIFAYNSNGNLYPHPYFGTEQRMSNPPSGYTLLDAIDDTDATAQAAYTACESLQSQQYVVQGGALVANPAWSAIELSNAKTAQTALIEQAYASAMGAGFTSSADGTARVYGWQTTDALNLDLVQSAIDHAIETFPVAYADINGDPVSITDQTMLTALDKDASTFAWGNTTKGRSLLAQIKAATTVADVQAVVWS